MFYKLRVNPTLLYVFYACFELRSVHSEEHKGHAKYLYYKERHNSVTGQNEESLFVNLGSNLSLCFRVVVKASVLEEGEVLDTKTVQTVERNALFNTDHCPLQRYIQVI